MRPRKTARYATGRLGPGAQDRELHGVAGATLEVDVPQRRGRLADGPPVHATTRSPARSPAASAGVPVLTSVTLTPREVGLVLDVEAELDHPPGEGVVGEPEAVAQDVVAAEGVGRPQPAVRDPRRRESRRRGEPRDPRKRLARARHARDYGSPRRPTSSASDPPSRGGSAGRRRRASGARRGPPGARRPRRPWSGRGSPTPRVLGRTRSSGSPRFWHWPRSPFSARPSPGTRSGRAEVTRSSRDRG